MPIMQVDHSVMMEYFNNANEDSSKASLDHFTEELESLALEEKHLELLTAIELKCKKHFKASGYIGSY